MFGNDFSIGYRILNELLNKFWNTINVDVKGGRSPFRYINARTVYYVHRNPIDVIHRFMDILT